MWDETLIESMGRRNNGKRWLTVQIAAIVHAGVIAILAAASFWYVDIMSLPVQSQTITDVFFPKSLPSPPASYGIPKPATQEKPALSEQTPKRTEPLTQEQLVPEEPNFKEPAPSTPSSDIKFAGDIPVGVSLNRVPGAYPNSSGNGGLGVPGGTGTGTDGPLEQDRFIELGVEQPVVVRRVEPVYPPPLLRIHKEGTVILEAVISASGSVQEIRIIRSDHSLFAQSAINAVSQWTYRPAKLRGKPIAVYFQVTVMFKIR